jgi:hypothetical protein
VRYSDFFASVRRRQDSAVLPRWEAAAGVCLFLLTGQRGYTKKLRQGSGKFAMLAGFAIIYM